MIEPLYLPVTDSSEIAGVLDGFPGVVDTDSFVDFVRGFPRRYLEQTPQLDIVKHFLLAQNLGSRRVISTLAKDQNHWKLSLITRDRSFLFVQISGTLSCFGMNILAAEGFANARALVLDTLIFEDTGQRFREPTERQRLQSRLEDIISGERSLDGLIKKEWPEISSWTQEHLVVSFDNESHPQSTVMRLKCRDRFGLLYLISKHLAEQGFSIEMLYVRTQRREADDEFYLQRRGRKLNQGQMKELSQAFSTFRTPRFTS